MKILIVGDSCKDIFVYGEITKLSPEAPVPVFNPIKQKENGGMDHNVFNNLVSLGVDATLVTNRDTNIRKVRYVDNRSNQMVLRIDENDECEEIDEIIRMHICNNQYQNKTYDAIVISDYCKGFLDEIDINSLCKSNKNVFVDTKKKLGDWVRHADYLKINSIEYEQNKDFLQGNDILDKTIITKGRQGCLFRGKIYLTEDVPVKDISGAGDTFLAGLVVEYIRSNDIVKAIKFAQECTTIVVQKHGVSTV